MAPTTAADRMLVTNSIPSSLDWMLSRDITRRRRLRGFGAGSGWIDVPESVIVVIESKRLSCETY
jgi:hypothetical protein